MLLAVAAAPHLSHDISRSHTLKMRIRQRPIGTSLAPTISRRSFRPPCLHLLLLLSHQQKQPMRCTAHPISEELNGREWIGAIGEQSSEEYRGHCKGLFLFHILSPVAFCYLPSFMSFSVLDFSQVWLALNSRDLNHYVTPIFVHF